MYATKIVEQHEDHVEMDEFVLRSDQVAMIESGQISSVSGDEMTRAARVHHHEDRFPDAVVNDRWKAELELERREYPRTAIEQDETTTQNSES